MTPPEAQGTRQPAGAPPAPPAVSVCVMKTRPEFLKAASARRQGAGSFLLQARDRREVVLTTSEKFTGYFDEDKEDALAIKLHDSVANTTEIILRPFESRLCEYLLQTAQNGVFSERLIDVAEQLGVSYRHLLRSLKALCEEGLLEKRMDGYHLLNEAKLREKAAG